MRLRIRAISMSLPAAILLTIVLAGQVLAAAWSAPMTLASAEAAFLNGLVTLDGGTAAALYIEHKAESTPVGYPYAVTIRRSTDGGASWEPPTILAASGYFSAIGGYGSKVDVVWVEEGSGQVFYVRSTDSGASFGTPLVLSRANGQSETGVARGPGGVVAAVWQGRGGAIKARVSTNGGRSFRPVTTVSAGSDQAGSPVAVGDGVIYVAYMRAGSLYLGRSLNLGATWRSVVITDNMGGYWWHNFGLTAAGKDAYVVYPAGDGSIRYRRTTDRGASWAAERRLSRDRMGGHPRIALQGGIVRTVFNAAGGLFYRESADGVSWTAPEKISGIGGGAYVGLAGRVVVAYGVKIRDNEYEVRARNRAP